MCRKELSEYENTCPGVKGSKCQVGPCKLKSFCTSTWTISEAKNKPTEKGRSIASDTSKGSLSRIDNKIKKSSSGNKWSNQKKNGLEIWAESSQQKKRNGPEMP